MIRTTRTARFQLLAICSLAGLIAASDASAAMIVDSLRFDAKVRRNGNNGIEHHFRNIPYGEDDNGVALLARPAASLLPLPPDGNLPSGNLFTGQNLETRLVESGGELNGIDYERATIWVTPVGAMPWFNNPLRTNLAPPDANIEMDAFLYHDNLPANKKINIVGVRYEDGTQTSEETWPAPIFTSISDGIGSEDDPIRVLVRLDGGELSRSPWLKLSIYWEKTDRPIVPEPASFVLMLVGAAAIFSARRRG